MHVCLSVSAMIKIRKSCHKNDDFCISTLVSDIICQINLKKKNLTFFCTETLVFV